MEPKKISFGFSKINKKINLLPIKETAKTVSNVELIKCLEGQEIKLVEEKPEEKPLTIPLKDSQKTSTALASLLKRRAVLLGEDEEPEKKVASSIEAYVPPINGETEDIEKRAARELLSELQENNSSDTKSNLVLPVVKPDDLPLEGATESTLNDYENIPIQDFGKAMLRGMGWTDPLPLTNKKTGPPVDDTPMVRPKGMGLGADKSLNKKPLLVAPEANEILEIKRNAFVRILGGKYKDLYGQIEGFDDHAGRVIVKLAIGGAKEAFNEFLCQPVSRKEYAQYAKCINSSKYDEYKKQENEFGQIKLDKNVKDLKKEKKYSANDKNYCKTIDRHQHYKTEKDIKQEKDSIRKKEETRDGYKYEAKTERKEEPGRKEDRGRTTDDKYHRRKYDDRSPRRDKHSGDHKYRREEDRNDIKFRKDIEEEKCRSSKSDERSTKRDRYQHKAVVDSSDFESSNYSSKHRKSKKSHSKKSKKGKSKHKHASSDTESSTSSTESSSNEERERTKKYKKKTKKSKKHRERSHSRGRQ